MMEIKFREGFTKFMVHVWLALFKQFSCKDFVAINKVLGQVWVNSTDYTAIPPASFGHIVVW